MLLSNLFQPCRLIISIQFILNWLNLIFTADLWILIRFDFGLLILDFQVNSMSGFDDACFCSLSDAHRDQVNVFIFWMVWSYPHKSLRLVKVLHTHFEVYFKFSNYLFLKNLNILFKFCDDPVILRHLAIERLNFLKYLFQIGSMKLH